MEVSTSDIRLTPITRADRQPMLDLFNHYGRHGFAAFAEEPLPLPFMPAWMRGISHFSPVK